MGSGALSMLAAVLLAGIMEFAGAASMGEPTIDTFQTNVRTFNLRLQYIIWIEICNPHIQARSSGIACLIY